VSWSNVQHVSTKTHTYNVLWIFNNHPPSSHQEEWFLILLARFSTRIFWFQISMLLSTSNGFLLNKVSTLTQHSSPWCTTCLAQSATLRGRMCNNMQSCSSHKDISHAPLLQGMRHGPSVPCKIGSTRDTTWILIVSFLHLVHVGEAKCSRVTQSTT
jgi:hypothetical protein